jgi:hypothetical protein
MSKKPHPEDIQPCALPSTVAYLWTYFWDLNAGRPICQAGYLPIPAVEIRAWEELNEQKLRPFELAAIRRLDALFLKIAAEK